MVNFLALIFILKNTVLRAFTAMAQVQSLTRELKSHKLHGIAREKQKELN